MSELFVDRFEVMDLFVELFDELIQALDTQHQLRRQGAQLFRMFGQGRRHG